MNTALGILFALLVLFVLLRIGRSMFRGCETKWGARPDSDAPELVRGEPGLRGLSRLCSVNATGATSAYDNENL
jgi:hypothetical protein